MSQIEVSVYDQTAYFTHTPNIYSGDIGVDTIKFTFDDAWTDFNTKTAIFYNQPKKSYPVILDSNNMVTIPSAVINTECKLYFGVMGVKPNGNVKTSSILSYKIERGVITADTEVLPTNTDVWLQILKNYEWISQRITNMTNDVNSKVEDIKNKVDVIEARVIESAQENKANINFDNITSDAKTVILNTIVNDFSMDLISNGTKYSKLYAQMGRVNLASGNNDVTFSKSFKNPPVVLISPTGSGTVYIGTITKYAFSVVNGNCPSMTWIAFGEPV